MSAPFVGPLDWQKQEYETLVDAVGGTKAKQVSVVGSASFVLVQQEGEILSASLAYPVSLTGSGSVVIVQQEGEALSASLAYPVWGGGGTIDTVGQLIGDVRATNLGIRPLTSNSDTVNVTTVAALTNVGQVIGDIRSTNLGIRTLTSNSDTVNVPTVGTVGTVANVVGDVRGTNFGIRPLTSSSDIVGAALRAETTGGYDYYNITGASTITIKGVAGTLHTVTINTKGTQGTLTLRDTNTARQIGVIDTTQNVIELTYDIAFPTGLTAVNSASLADITLTYK